VPVIGRYTVLIKRINEEAQEKIRESLIEKEGEKDEMLEVIQEEEVDEPRIEI
jgi:hypothetical protein